MDAVVAFIGEVTKTLMAAGVIVGVVSYVARSWIRQYLAKDLEEVKQQHALALAEYKETFARETGTLLAEAKHKYDLEAMRHSRYHERLVEIAADTYKRLLDYKAELTVYVMLPVRDDGANEKVAASRDAFGEAFYHRELVFPASAAKSIRELDSKFDRVWRLMDSLDEKGPGRSNNLEEWKEARNIIESEVPDLFAKVFKELRVVIGASDSCQSVNLNQK